MKLIYDVRGSGKTKRLFEYAQKNNGVIITDNASALRVKAQAYGYNDIEIIEASRLESSNIEGKNILIRNLDRFVENYFKIHGATFIGATMTEEG